MPRPCHGKGKEAEALLDAIVERKDNLRETYRAFYSDLLTERTGRKQIFTWADEVAQQAKQPLAAVTHSADALKKMNVAELKQLAKQKGIPYYNKFNKKELIEAISDPVKAVEISAKTKAKLLNLEATRPERLGRTTEKPPRPPRTGAVDAGDLFQDFGQIPPQRIGRRGIQRRGHGGGPESDRPESQPGRSRMSMKSPGSWPKAPGRRPGTP